MTATPTPLRELVAKWRKRATCCDPDTARELNIAADELETALSARQEAGAVAWQYRYIMGDVGYWSGWCQCQSEADAVRLVARYAELGQKAEWRALFATPPASGEAGAVEKLQAFKDYVHQRLDAMGVPVDPESPHKAAGCRIGGRLDYVEANLATPSASGEAGADADGVGDAAARQAIVFMDRLWGSRMFRACVSSGGEINLIFGATANPFQILIDDSGVSYHGYLADGSEACASSTNAIEFPHYDELRRLAAVAPAGMDGWIPVSERLPEEYGWYHCVVEGVGDLGMARWQEIVSLGHYADYGKRFSTFGGARVTHWKPLGPLPTPPATAGQE